MIIRNVIRQLETPDSPARPHDRRQHGVLSGGPQLGSSSGRRRQLARSTISVVSGGIGCLIATGWVAASTPALRNYRREAETTAAVAIGKLASW